MSTLMLSRLTLNLLRREAQRDLADCHNMHRRLLSAFPDLPDLTRAREHYGLLYRVEQRRERVTILAQSRALPDWDRLPQGYLLAAPEVKSLNALYDHLRPGMELLFRLHANPTRRISGHNAQQGERWRGKRVNLSREADQLDWLRRKGEGAGFTLLTVRTQPEGLSVSGVGGRHADSWQPVSDDGSASSSAQATQHVLDARAIPGSGGGVMIGRRTGTGTLTFGAVTLEGRLRITDLERFRSVLEQGIGSGKAYGFGLLSIAPVTGINDGVSASDVT